MIALGRRTQQQPAPAIAVIGAVGGTWASTLAMSLGAALEALTPWLVELHTAGNLETQLGLEDTQGLRWAELAEVRGEVDTKALRDLCPRYGETTVVMSSHAQAGLPEHAAILSLLHSLRSQRNTVVLDTHASTLSAYRDVLTHVVIVTPLTLQALSSTLQLARLVENLGFQPAIVTSEARPPELTTKQFQAAAGRQIGAHIKRERALPPAVSHGLGPLGGPARTTQRLVAAAAATLDYLDVHAD